MVSAVEAVEVHGRGGSRSVFIKFRLQGVDKNLTYTEVMPNHWEARDRLRLKVQARVLYTQDRSGNTTLWGLAVGGHSVIEPAETYATFRRQGYAALACAIFFSIVAGVMFVGAVRALTRARRAPRYDTTW
jgi:hypothetical protein